MHQVGAEGLASSYNMIFLCVFCFFVVVFSLKTSREVI